MTLRERIADWICEGKLSTLHEAAKMAVVSLRDKQSRLDRIAAQETPGANATVQRMARIARGEE